MIWIALVGMLAVVAAAVVIARRQGGGWWRYLLAGAAGWVVAQAVKGVILAPATVGAMHQGGATAVAHMAAQWWFLIVAALLPGVVEELGKYVPLRWMHVEGRGAALALGLGAGALEALAIAASLAAVAGGGPHGETLAAAFIAVWERFWAVALHAGLATLAGLAVVQRRIRWLLLAMGLHTAADLGAAWYQHAGAVGATAGAQHNALLVAELAAAVAAIIAWVWGKRAWAARA